MKSYIEKELKRNKIPKKNYNTTKESNRGPIYWQATPTSKPSGHSVAGLQSTDISCTMLAYIYTARMRHALSRVYWSAQVSAVFARRR